MEEPAAPPVAIVGIGAAMPDASDAATFWNNIKAGHYSIRDVPAGRWDPELYYDSDPGAPDKTYSKIGGWVTDFVWEPMKWKLPIPPKVSEHMDPGQRWSVACSRAALLDAGWPNWNVDPERVAVIFGNALGGDKHYATSLRIMFPEFARELRNAPSFAALPESIRESVIAETHKAHASLTPDITEDTMPGELSNVIAGRVCNLFNFRGPNFTADAACASGLAAMNAAVDGLRTKAYDAVLTGGVDSNNGISAFVKFCKIGALSATGTRPFDAGADGFVMGEGAVVYALKRLEDAERDGDRIYAVLLSFGGSSDGKGKGITAPNPAGQKLAIERAWRNAGADPATMGLLEAHGTSTRAGDAGELESMLAAFGHLQVPPRSIALGSVKSNIGHLKAAAGVAGLFKTVMSLHEKVLTPSLHFNTPNPNVDWSTAPFAVNTELREFPPGPSGARIAGVSAFGFGGTNFHAVVEEYVPGRRRSNEQRFYASAGIPEAAATAGASAGTATANPVGPTAKAPLRGALVVGAANDAELAERLQGVVSSAASIAARPPTAPLSADLRAPVRVAIDYGDAAELSDKAGKALKAVQSGQPAAWKMLRSRGVFLGRGTPPKTAFLYTGQGSQYVNMLKELRAVEPIVADTFDEADKIMTPLLGRPLSSYIFIDADDPAAVANLEKQLLQTEITQPAVLTTDAALTRLLDAYGIRPDMVMGHSLGEYGALVAANSLTVPAALEAVSARGREMASLSMGDNGAMAAVLAPLPEIERIVAKADGYVVIANVNSNKQAVIGGATPAVEKVIDELKAEGQTAIRLPVSHAFHTSIVAPATEPLKVALRRLNVVAPQLPLVANVDGEFYPTGPDATEKILDILGRQVASPVQFVKGLHTLYDAGARLFVELGPKKALHGFAEEVIVGHHDDASALFTNHPKGGDIVAFNQALVGLYAAGLGAAADDAPVAVTPPAPTASAAAPARVAPALAAQAAARPAAAIPAAPAAPAARPAPVRAAAPPAPRRVTSASAARGTHSGGSGGSGGSGDRYTELGYIFADAIERGLAAYAGAAPGGHIGQPSAFEPVVITGAALGLPGTDHVFDDSNIGRLLAGEQFIDVIPQRFRRRMLDKHITRVVKDEDGSGSFETIVDTAEVIKLAGRMGALDVVREFGIDADRDAALDVVTRLAVGAGFDALRDAGIPLVLKYKTTSIGTQLPDRWMLPDALRDDTGIVFASAFPGSDRLADEFERYWTDRARRQLLDALLALRARASDGDPVMREIDERIRAVRDDMDAEPYTFDRRFLFQVLSMGHSQFAEIIGARGPNTQVNSACASTTQGIALAEDWIRAGRCRRVLVVAGDNVTSDHLIEWIGSGFLATGAAATDENVEDAALPFDNRRHGMIMGMGAAGIVVEAADAAAERGVQPICEVLGTVTANSAFHGTRLDVDHIGGVMEDLVRQAESRGYERHAMAPEMVFVSHETYTPARGGSAAAEIYALRATFDSSADQIVIANTKGFTGHPMGVGVEDVLAIKSLETGIVPPIPNFQEIDPTLGALHLSRGGPQPVQYALRLAAGFGSQISMVLLRWTPMPDGLRRAPADLGFSYRIIDPQAWHSWLAGVTGVDDPQLEVAQRRLRVVDPGMAGRGPAARPITPPAAQPAPRITEVPLPPAAAVPPPAPAPVAPPTPAPVAPAPVPIPTQAAPPAAAPAPAAAAPAAPAGDPVLDKVLSVVAEKTGYPPDMLDPELDMEADLGIDTVKQAEVFASIREAFGIERDDTVRLRDYPTLISVVGFVRERAGIPAPTAPTAAPAAPAAAAAAPAGVPAPAAAPAGPVADPVLDKVLSVVADKTGYPPDMLDPELDMEADLGIDTVKQAEVFASIREAFGIERDDTVRLRDYPTLISVVGFVRERAGIPAPSAAPAAPAAPAAVPAQAAPAAPAGDPVLDKVLSVVADKTGYPPDMLDPELDMEADLGIDTVKQAEVFASIREAFGIERDDTIKLRDYPTLISVVGFVRERAGIAAPTATPAPTAAETPAAPAAPSIPAQAAPAAPGAPAADPVIDKVLSVVADKTGYPPDMLDPELDMEADLGIDTVKQAEVFASIRETFGIERDDTIKLRDYPTLGHVIGFVRERAGLPAPTAPAPVAPAATAAAAATGGDVVVDKVLSVVADKTGYPPEMLDPELDMEADLGIDTVKQAEVFASIREAFGIERDDTIKLRDYPTLNHVIGFVRERAQGLPAAAGSGVSAPQAGVQAAAPTAGPAGFPPPPAGSIEAANAVPRRVPVPVLRPALGLCKPTGVNLGEGTRVVLAPDRGGVGEALAKRLAKLNVEVLTLDPAADRDALVAQLDGWLTSGPVHGVYWLTALDDEGPVAALDSDGWHEALRVRVKNLVATMKRLYDDTPFLVSGTRLGGLHGYEPDGALCPLGGAVTGFTKAYKREQPDVLVKAVDFPASRKSAALADRLIEETLTDPGCVEVGGGNGTRWSIGLDEQPAADGKPSFDMHGGTVYVVTGAAGSIVSAITADLARHGGGGIFHLLDLTPKPDENDADLRTYVANRDALKAELIARKKAAGEKVTPVMIDKDLAGIERLSMAQAAIEAIRSAGGQAIYHSVNLTDAQAVADVVNEIANAHGRIDVLIHAAGLEISKRLKDKELREYDLVFDVKSDGWFNLLHAIGDLPVGATVGFSSIAGRFGNQGQTDYSAANDLLCKLTSNLRRSRPDTRGIVLDWTAWGGIGMATRGSIPTIMAAAGIDMLPPDAGIATIRRELTAGGTRDEVVVAGSLGVMMTEFDETGGLDTSRIDVADAGPMMGRVTGMGVWSGLTVETTLDPTSQPFLYDHRIDGTPVLPGVMGVEAFAEIARLAAPGWYVSDIEDVDFREPFKFYRDEPRTVKVRTTVSPVDGGLAARCELIGTRTLANRPEPVTTVHHTGTVRLREEEPEAERDGVESLDGRPAVGHDDVYRIYFHGPAYQVLDEAWKTGAGAAARFSASLPANHEPHERPTVAEPRLIELCFQTAGIEEMGNSGKMGLPTHIDRIHFPAHADAGDALVAEADSRGDGVFDARVVDTSGRVLVRLTGYRTAVLPGDVDNALLGPLRAAMTQG